jgi:hypothetical protein
VSKRIGDTSRRRRFADPARQAWYALHRARRFARRFFGMPVMSDRQDSALSAPTG